MRIVLGVLVVLNLVAAGLVLYPPGGSAETLEEDLVRLQAQIKQSKTRLDTTKKNVEAVEKGRGAAGRVPHQVFHPAAVGSHGAALRN